MARYLPTTTFANPNVLRATQLEAEYEAIEDSANSVVDIDAANTQFNLGDFPTRKLARHGAPMCAVTTVSNGTVPPYNFVDKVADVLIDTVELHRNARVLGISVGAIHDTSTPLATTGFGFDADLPASVEQVTYVVVATRERPDSTEYPSESAVLVASLEREDVRTLAVGSALEMGVVVSEMRDFSYLSLWGRATGTANGPVPAPGIRDYYTVTYHFAEDLTET